MTKKNPVIHFEMPFKNKEKLSEFYQGVFGWDLNQMPAEYGEYVVATTTECDENGRPKNPGSINGGFFKLEEDKLDMYPSIVIAVDDIKEYMEKVKAAGGEILNEPMDIPGVGIYVSIRDTQGNRLSLLQPS